MDGECDRLITEKELFLFIDTKNNEINNTQIQELKSKYQRFRRNMQLAKDPNVRWCIKPGCDTPIIITDKKLLKKLENSIAKQTKNNNKNKNKNNKNNKKTIANSSISSIKVNDDFKLTCSKCNTEICFNCAAAWHGDINLTCDDVLDKKLDEWAISSSKDVQYCPKCNARIEKLEGCNHMTCSYCKYEFCWLCRKEYKKGHYNRTNIFGGCPGAEHGNSKPDRCKACCSLCNSCLLSCILPCRICWWKMQDQGTPWCLCWCCCD